MKQIPGECQSHVVALVGRSSKIVHPPFVVDLLRNNRARFGPSSVPVSFVRRKQNALALPMHQVSRSSQAELCVLLVVAGVGQVIRAADLQYTRIFDPAIFFILGCRDQDRTTAAGEVETIGTGGIPDARSAGGILLAIKQNCLAIFSNRRRIECTCRCSPGIRRDEWSWTAPENLDFNRLLRSASAKDRSPEHDNRAQR